MGLDHFGAIRVINRPAKLEQRAKKCIELRGEYVE
jgi:hypothetical protein